MDKVTFTVEDAERNIAFLIELRGKVEQRFERGLITKREKNAEYKKLTEHIQFWFVQLPLRRRFEYAESVEKSLP